MKFAVAVPSKRAALTIGLVIVGSDPANMALVDPDANPGVLQVLFYFLQPQSPLGERLA